MSEHYTYIWVDVLCVVFPFIFSFHPKIGFSKQWKYFLTPWLVTALFFVVWDIFFTSINVWWFDSRYVIGMWWQGMPVEEYLFFLCIPYSCVFTYHVLTSLLKVDFTKWEQKAKAFTIYVLIPVLVIVGTIYHNRYYTFSTAILLAIALIIAVLVRFKYFAQFYFSYSILLIPFTISNGVLTGSFLGRVVVHYNNTHNLGIRMLTIPVEDIFYGMLLIFMTVLQMEYRKSLVVKSGR